MKNTTLVIMAAGIGRRFGGGGVKQLTSFGPSGEIIMDYSIYDAIEAGFNKVVFVIRKSMLEDFRQVIGNRIEERIPVEYAFQEMEDLPEGFIVPEGREKPWGTGQAILACRGIVKEPFAVINADDYYGKDAFRKVHDYLENVENKEDGGFQFCMAGFVLKNTLSEHGGVTRGICQLSDGGELSEIKETKNIVKTEQGAAVVQEDGSMIPLDADSLVSMNFWGFTPDFIDELESGFKKFLSGLEGNALTAEYLLPTIVDGLIKEKRVDLTVLPSGDKWFGVTFKEDVPYVKEAFADLVEKGIYPKKLF
ncbi:MAG: sugar phosphate nucleotidyltransferase [Lachnospiraceae bacterium]|nr:sugar phosphate nucleotidyltransferase [Lachnospiraceae bacterium]